MGLGKHQDLPGGSPASQFASHQSANIDKLFHDALGYEGGRGNFRGKEKVAESKERDESEESRMRVMR